MTDRYDVFPSLCVDEVPESRFDLGPNAHCVICSKYEVTPFIHYQEENGKIYFKLIEMTDKERSHFGTTMKQLRDRVRVNVEKIDWLQIARRLRRDTSGESKRNADIRMGFIWENHYLVKYCATFGVRKVRPDEMHVYQVGYGKLLCYKLKSQSKWNCE